MLCENIGVNGNHLTFAGRDVTELAEKYGTALYLMDEDKIRSNCRVYKKAMADHFGEGSFPVFASKAACFKLAHIINHKVANTVIHSEVDIKISFIVAVEVGIFHREARLYGCCNLT